MKCNKKCMHQGGGRNHVVAWARPVYLLVAFQTSIDPSVCTRPFTFVLGVVNCPTQGEITLQISTLVSQERSLSIGPHNWLGSFSGVGDGLGLPRASSSKACFGLNFGCLKHLWWVRPTFLS